MKFIQRTVKITWGQFHKRYFSHQLLKSAWAFPTKISLTFPRGQEVNINKNASQFNLVAWYQLFL